MEGKNLPEQMSDQELMTEYRPYVEAMKRQGVELTPDKLRAHLREVAERSRQEVEKPAQSPYVQQQRAQREATKAQREVTRLQKVKPYCLQYGLDAERDREKLNAIINAFKHMSNCVGCNGRDCIGNVGPHEFEVPRIADDGTVEYVACDVEVKRKLKKLLPKRYADKTFDDYEQTPENKRAIGAAQWFIGGGNRGLYLYGGVGTGKTFLASLITKSCVLKRRQVIFRDMPGLLDDLKITFNDPNTSSQKVLRKFIACEVLILDDVGANGFGKWNVDILYQIVNGRWADEKPIIITSNYSMTELLAQMQAVKEVDKTQALRIVDRLRDTCHELELGGKSRRGS